MNVADVLDLLERVRRSGGGWQARCPAHEDRHPSLSIGEGEDGRILLDCHAGCTVEQIVAAIGLTVSDLFPENRDARARIVATYDYPDSTDTLVFQVVRYQPKGFAQRRPDGNGGWVWNLRGVPRPLPLYHLPEVVAAVAEKESAVWIVEGEKHADLLHDRGRVATTNPMGAGKWRGEYADTLAGARRVIVLADDDTAGREHAETIARSLVGRVGEVKLVKLWPDGETGRDVIDFYRAAESARSADKALGTIAKDAPVYGAVETTTSDDEPKPSPPPSRLTATPLTEIEMRSIEWFDRPLWQASAYTLFVGAKGSGKGTYLALLAAQASRAGLNVLFVSSEDSAAIDLKPRLVAAGAVMERCFVIKQHLRLPKDVNELHTLADSLGGVGLLVIDPVANHIGDRNSNSDAEVRDAIAPLNQLADELRCVLIGVRHPGKDRSRGALASILGSVAWVDTPRAVVMVAVDDEDEDVRHIQVVAGNRSRNGAAQSFRIDAVTVTGLAEPVTVAVALGESNKSIEDLLAATRAADSASRTADARESILDVLERDGDQESDTFDVGIASETGLSARTVRNIRKQLADDGLVKSYPERDEFGSVARWKVGRTAASR